MKLIYQKNQLKKNINSMNGRVVTLNNEYLYLLNNSLSNHINKISFMTIDSGYILSFLNFFSKKNIQLITGIDFFYTIKEISERKIIVIGKELKDEFVFLKRNSNIIKINAIYGTPKDIYDDMLLKYDFDIFENSIILIMLGAEKQEILSNTISSNLKSNNSLIVGLGGTWEQILSNKKVPIFFINYKLSWLYRTIKFWDNSKPKKIYNSIIAFFYFFKILTWIKR
jgi:UDP-N-acetyl-D-mannosaminuronic acid transferase (WecB/TagA/CpsF family)